MLLYICEFCDERYKAKYTINGVKYVDGLGVEYHVERETDPCYNCEKIAEEAKQVALASRKKTAT